MQKYALVLFDEDGCTAVVETRKLYGDVPLCPSVQCMFGMAMGNQYEVEILQMSDSKSELNKFEKSWSVTHRSVALDEAKKRQGARTGGYLSVWPENQTESRDELEIQPATSEEQTHATKRSRTVPTVRLQRIDSQTAEAETSARRQSPQDSIITGTNQRKITVLFEGGGDYSSQSSEPERNPFFTDHLTKDQTEMLLLQVTEHKKNMRSFATQTKKVVVMEDDEEVKSLLVRDTPPKETCTRSACDCKCEELKDVINENSRKLDRLTDLVTSLKDMLSEKLNTSLISVSMLESLGVNTENVSAHVVDISGKMMTAEEGMEDGSSEDHGTNPVNESKETEDACLMQNVYSMFTSPPASHALQEIPSPAHKRCFSAPCGKGPIVEVTSYAEIPSGDIELRCHPDVQRKLKMNACSVGNFGWLLVKLLYTNEELLGTNYHGRKGKHQLSPRRVHAIEHAALDMYGEGENVKSLANAINTGIRNAQRQPFKQLFIN